MTSDTYFRPIAVADPARPQGALPLAGGASWFDAAECLSRSAPARIVPLRDLPGEVRDRLAATRPPFGGVTLDAPRLMGIVNATPDSFSDGGRYQGGAAVEQARLLATAGADFLDIGGESTRPGAATVPEDEESARVVAVIAALSAGGDMPPLSIDTRKAAVARAALDAGARVVNDVSALGHDERMAPLVAERAAPVVLMHARGEPATMQDAPHYDNVLLDVYDWLEARVRVCEREGIPRARIAVDPGIGFGKTRDHNLALIRGLSLFHGLGCAIVLGVSRKGFIGAIGGEPAARRRAPGSIALALEGLRQGVQILRVHDISETRQAVALWRAAR